MPIDLVIDERETGPSGTKAEGLPGDSNNNANRSNADSASHTDGASTPEVVSQISRVFFVDTNVCQLWASQHFIMFMKKRPILELLNRSVLSGEQTLVQTLVQTNKQRIGAALPNNDIFSLLFSLIFPSPTLHSVRFSN